MFIRTSFALVVALTCLFGVSGCGAPQGPHIRFAQATSAQLQSAQNEEVVWYEFHAGDEVPMVFVLRGIVEADAPQAISLRATRDFQVVVFQDGRQFFSFDGRHLFQGELGKFGLFLTSNEGRPMTGVMLFIGQREVMPAELR